MTQQQEVRDEGQKGFVFSGFFFAINCDLLSSLDNIIGITVMFQSTVVRTQWVRSGAMGRLWHNYKERTLKRMKSRSFMLACVRHVECMRTGTFYLHSLTFACFQDDPAVFGSKGIVHLAKIDSCKALRVVADFQLPSHTVWENTHKHRWSHGEHMCCT